MGLEGLMELLVNIVGSLLFVLFVFFPPIIAFVRLFYNLNCLSRCNKEDEDNRYKRNNCIGNLIIDVLIITVYFLGFAIIMKNLSDGMAHM